MMAVNAALLLARRRAGIVVVLALPWVLSCSRVGGGPGAEPSTVEPERSPAIFVDVTAESGVDFRHWNGATGDYYFPEIMGGGAALFDYDADGDLDLYLVQGAIVAPGKGPADAIDRAPSPYPPSDRLYRNDLDRSARRRRPRRAPALHRRHRGERRRRRRPRHGGGRPATTTTTAIPTSTSPASAALDCCATAATAASRTAPTRRAPARWAGA